MELLSYLRLARRSWWLMALAAGTGAGGAMLVTQQMPERYAATVSMLVSAEDDESTTAGAYQANLLSQQRVKSYANLIGSRRVVAAVAEPEGIAADVLARHVKAEAVPDTVLLKATVTDGDPIRAARMANAVGQELTELIDEIERPEKDGKSSIKVTIVDKAVTPDRPVSPRPLVNLSIGVLLSLLASGSMIVLYDRLDTTVKTPEDLQDATRGPVLGVVGFEKDAKQYPLIVRENGNSTRAEAFRAVRTNLQFVGIDEKPRSLVVTSCLPSEGKSSTSVNLAIALAQAGWRVLLVDADLRRPSVPDYLGIEGAIGLTNVLIGTATVSDALQTWGEDPIDVLTSGPIPPNPSELLSSYQMRQLLAEVRKSYDMVIVDAPPLLPVTDAATLAAVVDGVLLVARSAKTQHDHLVRARTQLDSVNGHLIGSILNFTPVKSAGVYGYDYNYEPVQTPAGV
ncbi:chromosome partitioning protein [Acrocarpospora phusangensis]|uniref:non-specific protein-tyrosine kinase n=1 Tax=Acrocarpospora phusangensis TaxID=1070424 RepID=A0A919QAY7_9ACTN|nr:polysaccharide biosynthesis tyrosine autokinase [Acrocarpospora phusangensis]GIH24015.1 chromosome partitioning protein [Acrocarpospora phusangensis]